MLHQVHNQLGFDKNQRPMKFLFLDHIIFIISQSCFTSHPLQSNAAFSDPMGFSAHFGKDFSWLCFQDTLKDTNNHITETTQSSFVFPLG